jgi:DNA polymerase IV
MEHIMLNQQSEKQRKIIHIDMDAFFAAVEQRDFPEFRGKPVIVGGDPDSRGVVATCSYEARKFGIHSAMSCKRASQLCPNAIFVRPRMDTYKIISSQIRKIFYEYSDKVEPLSIDEAFLDVTENKKGQKSATILAQEILQKIYEKTGLTASAGVSYNKFIAKVASDIQKPNGLTIITPDQAIEFIEQLPVKKIFGVGKVTNEKMKNLGILHGSDLKKLSKIELVEHFGKAGLFFYNIARGIDLRPVHKSTKSKSIGTETTLKVDIVDYDEIVSILHDLCYKVAKLVSNKHNGINNQNIKSENYAQNAQKDIPNKNAIVHKEKSGNTISLKVKYHDFETITRSKSCPIPFTESHQMMKEILKLLKKTEAGSRKIRLLGVTISNFREENTDEYPKQLLLPFEPIP